MKFLLLWLTIVPFLLFSFFARGGERDTTVDCNANDGPCVKQMGDTDVIFELTPRPVKAMEDLVVSVRIKGGGISTESIFVSFDMPGMEMGPNRTDLTKVEEGLYRGKAVIVKCPSGGDTWRAMVAVPGVGAVEFTFHVLY